MGCFFVVPGKLFAVSYRRQLPLLVALLVSSGQQKSSPHVSLTSNYISYWFLKIDTHTHTHTHIYIYIYISYFLIIYYISNCITLKKKKKKESFFIIRMAFCFLPKKKKSFNLLIVIHKSK